MTDFYEEEPNNNPAQAQDLGAVKAGYRYQLTGYITAADATTGDLDVFIIQPEVEGTLMVRLDWLAASSDYDLVLLNQAGQVIDGYMGATAGQPEMSVVSVTAGSVLFVVVQGFQGNPGFYFLDYRYVVNEVEPNNTPNEPTIIGWLEDGVTEMTLGTLSTVTNDGSTWTGDQDWFLFGAQQVGTLSVRLDWMSTGSDYDFVLYRRDGNSLVPLSVSGTDAKPEVAANIPAAAGAYYYLRIAGWSGSPGVYTCEVTYTAN